MKALVAALLLTTSPALAQAPMVQCVVGAWSAVVPDYACQAIHRAAGLITYQSGGPNHGINNCARALAPYTDQPWQMAASAICTDIVTRNVLSGRERLIER